jgi:hypothetical protein
VQVLLRGLPGDGKKREEQARNARKTSQARLSTVLIASYVPYMVMAHLVPETEAKKLSRKKSRVEYDYPSPPSLAIACPERAAQWPCYTEK